MKKSFVVCVVFVCVTVLLIGGIWRCMSSIEPINLTVSQGPYDKAQFLDRHGEPLTITYKSNWNLNNQLENFPDFLIRSVIFVEDQRFFEHSGVDWLARSHALIQNVFRRNGRRGASTITEQVVKLWHGERKRTYWGKFLEGLEAQQLEKHYNKIEILNFYLNQAPYAHNMRGVKNAAWFYFARDVATLSQKEMLALVALLRAPSAWDPKKSSKKLELIIGRIAKAMLNEHKITNEEFTEIMSEKLVLKEGELAVEASHYVQYLQSRGGLNVYNNIVKTTLDASLQKKIKNALDRQIARLSKKHVSNGAVLVVDVVKNEILAWVVAGDFNNDNYGQLDAVNVLRQPGSTLKPFLYAQALEKGWSAATIILDAPLAGGLNKGIHHYRNFGGQYYGNLRLREALANSLNTPAIRGINFVGQENFYKKLHSLGFKHLNLPAEHYGLGLVLGNGEVSLYELVRAYAVFARRGIYRDIEGGSNEKVIYAPETAEIINDILSDPEARKLEFGRSSLFQFPTPVAFKTGTSSDYRDAWTVAYSEKYVVGIWLGNYNRQPMDKITGSTGAMAVARVAFSDLAGVDFTRTLELTKICSHTGLLPGKNCPVMEEIFVKPPTERCSGEHNDLKKETVLKIIYPVKDMTFAIDPRVSRSAQSIFLEANTDNVVWYLDGHMIGTGRRLLWQLEVGNHLLQAVKKLSADNKTTKYSEEIAFRVLQGR